MMMMSVSGKDGNTLFTGSVGSLRRKLPQPPERVTASPVPGGRAAEVRWRLSGNDCFKEPKVAELRLALQVAHAAPDPDHAEGGTAGSRGEPVFCTASYATATFVDVPITDLEGTSRMDLPEDAALLCAADSAIPTEERRAGSNLPTFVSRGDDGSVQLRLRVAVRSISDEGAMGWSDSLCEPWEHAAYGSGA